MTNSKPYICELVPRPLAPVSKTAP